jgi:hypothetical protein
VAEWNWAGLMIEKLLVRALVASSCCALGQGTLPCLPHPTRYNGKLLAVVTSADGFCVSNRQPPT